MQEFLYKDLSYGIIGAAFEVHKILGKGFLENVYEEALAHEFKLNSIRFEKQKPLPVYYKNIIAKEYICDFLVEDKIIVELKAIKTVTNNDEAQLFNYLKATNMKVGILLNFGEVSLFHKRIVC